MNNDDIELVLQAQENDEDAKNYLYQKYHPLLEKKSYEIYKLLQNKGIDISDVYQEVLLIFEMAINEYDPEKDASFYTFLNICLKNKNNNLIARHNNNRNKILNESISMENVENIDTNHASRKLEEEFFDGESTKELYSKIKERLTSQEYEVFCLKADNIPIKEIAKRLNKDTKTIYNALQRIKLKVKDIIKEE